MKQHLVTLLLTFCCTLSFAQLYCTEPETAKPMRDKEIVRNTSIIDIEGVLYENVVVTIESISADYLIHHDDRVKVTVKNANGKKIWKKTLYNAHMYIFRSGQVQVGKPNFDQLVLFPSTIDNRYTGIIREKEGVY